MKKATSAYAGQAAILGNGIGDLMDDSGNQLAMLDLDDIDVGAQIREVFEDDDSSMDEMVSSVKKHGVFQTVLVRPIQDGPTPYRLVSGERRYRASKRAGELKIPCLIKEMTDDEAAEIQLAENIQRKNLTQIEQAKAIQKDLDKLGSVEAVLEKHSKGRAWLSKILSLLTLPEQTKRLVSENISADLEVINKVKTIEKHDPEEAKILVDELKKTRGKEDARKKADAVKEKVKPSKKEPKGVVATPKDLDHELPSAPHVVSFDAEEHAESNSGWPYQIPAKSAASGIDVPEDIKSKTSHALALLPGEVLNKAYMQIYEKDAFPKTVLAHMTDMERDGVEEWLHTFYDAGQSAKDMSVAVIQGIRKGAFSGEGDSAFALMAFLQGADSNVKAFNLLNILGSVKA